MAKKKQVSKQPQVDQAEKAVQYAALAVIALVVAFFLWRFIPWDTLFASSPEAAESAAGELKQYDSPPPMTIDTTKKYFATVELEKGGSFVIELYPDKAPVTVNNFVFLAREGFYDGVTFHRVLEGFMAQTGDPTGTGAGGPGYQFDNENSDLVFDKAGVVAMANSGPDTNGSQFFITFGPAEGLNGGYTIFGQVIEGMDVVNSITLRDPDANPAFTGDAIKTITISEE
ncbi:MAG: peptidylprolyl isomerase [Chloroflexi bacterium]|nr:peptidylprolyl isomerase [Chloroflexota bacterium]MDL1941701.1 peptidylprolyl isomerase [Chloroflexi bacterium CFX2]